MVYIVLIVYEYELSEIHGVYSYLEDAELVEGELKIKFCNDPNVSICIEEHEIK